MRAKTLVNIPHIEFPPVTQHPQSVISMYPTVETRWFFPGPLPDAARAWHEALGETKPALQARADLYLVSLAPDAPNVKLRAVDGAERRLEIKTRAGTLATQTLGPHAVGRVGRWTKWRLPLAEEAPDPDLLAASSDWIRVEKRRLSRVFVLDAGQVKEADLADAPPAGCDVELSEIETHLGRYWSVCLEAFGPDAGDLAPMLRRTAEHALAAAPPLPAARSLSYPEWLARIVMGAR